MVSLNGSKESPGAQDAHVLNVPQLLKAAAALANQHRPAWSALHAMQSNMLNALTQTSHWQLKV